MNTIYSVVVTFNGMQWIEKCISSLLSSTLPNHILVVDNLSTDGTPDFIKNEFPEVELFRSETNLGFGQGNNIGLKKALENNADFVFLLNQDACIKQDTLENLVNVSSKHPEFGVISPFHFMDNWKKLEFKFSEYASPFYCPDLFAEMAAGNLKEIYETKFVNAAAWFIPINTLKLVGGFDPLFPHYGEDEDYVERTKWKGLKIGICPSAGILHDRYFSWDKIKDNLNRKVIFYLIQLKKVSNTQRSQTLLVSLDFLNVLIKRLAFRKFKGIALEFKALRIAFSKSSKIKASRKKSKNEMAFLS